MLNCIGCQLRIGNSPFLRHVDCPFNNHCLTVGLAPFDPSTTSCIDIAFTGLPLLQWPQSPYEWSGEERRRLVVFASPRSRSGLSMADTCKCIQGNYQASGLASCYGLDLTLATPHFPRIPLFVI